VVESALARGMLRMNLTPAEPRGWSKPSKATWPAAGFRPAALRTSFSQTPPQTALPTPPMVQGLPADLSASRDRPLPEHSKVSAAMALGMRRIWSKVSVNGVATSPSTDNLQRAREIRRGGMAPWLRSKKTALGVIQDLRDSTGVSALSGLSVMTRMGSFMGTSG
jgi:hypothetical protein